MAFYDLTKDERKQQVETIQKTLLSNFSDERQSEILIYFSDEDTYIRKAAYLSVGRIYFENPKVQPVILERLEAFLLEEEPKVRQTVINAAGEIGKRDFKSVESFFEKGLFDEHHSVRNAVIGSIKKMGAKNSKTVLRWAKKYIAHPDREIRREICHGIELRGRTHPQDILPLLKQLQFDNTQRVSKTLVHVLGQIAYKKGCLQTVVEALKSWENQELIEKAFDEIVDVHYRYKNFAHLTQEEAMNYIDEHFERDNWNTKPT